LYTCAGTACAGRPSRIAAISAKVWRSFVEPELFAVLVHEVDFLCTDVHDIVNK
jgi:hypothetical protein